MPIDRNYQRIAKRKKRRRSVLFVLIIPLLLIPFPQLDTVLICTRKQKRFSQIPIRI